MYYMIMYVYTVSFDYIYFSMFTFIFKSSIFVFSYLTHKDPPVIRFLIKQHVFSLVSLLCSIN